MSEAAAVTTKPAKPEQYSHPGGLEPPRLKGGLPLLGHMVDFARNPYRFMKNASEEGGEVVAFKMFNQNIVLLTGPEASNAFYRAPDEQLDQSAAYKLMTPIFGEGIVFDAPIERKNEQLRMLMPSLQISAMRTHSTKVVQEVEDIIENALRVNSFEPGPARGNVPYIWRNLSILRQTNFR